MISLKTHIGEIVVVVLMLATSTVMAISVVSKLAEAKVLPVESVLGVTETTTPTSSPTPSPSPTPSEIVPPALPTAVATPSVSRRVHDDERDD
jgi:hypothetical protein